MRYLTLFLLVALSLCLSACAPPSGDALSDGQDGPGGSGGTIGQSAQVARLDETGFDFAYSDRDRDASYDESSAVTVTFGEAGIEVEGTDDPATRGVVITEGAVTLTEETTYLIRGSLSGRSLVVDASGEAKIQVVFDGVQIENSAAPAFLIESADKVFLTLAEGSLNSLSDGQGRSDLPAEASVDADADASTDASADASTDADEGHATHDATLFSHDDLTINGTGSLAVTSKSAHAVVSKDDLVITGGTFAFDAASDALQGKDCVKIADGNFDIRAGDDAITSTNSEEPDSTGFISIDGGTFEIDAVDDALHAETVLRLADGTVNVAACEEGYEAVQVWVQGGRHTIIAADDGVNAAGEARTEYLVDISGGTLTVTAQGDGLDSNGALTQSGGTVIINGPSESGNGALDALSATISGGTMLALGASGMAQTYGEGSTQAALLYSIGQSLPVNTLITLTDARGTELFSYASLKSFDSIAYSSPELVQGESYVFKANGEELVAFTLTEAQASVSADGTVNAYTGGGFGPGGQWPGGQGGQPPGGQGAGGQDGGGFGGRGAQPPNGTFDGQPPDGTFDGQPPDGSFDGQPPDGAPSDASTAQPPADSSSSRG